MSEASLTYQEAYEIYQALMANADKTDPDIAEIYDTLYQRAIQYAEIRSRWMLMSREERIAKDSGRSARHDAFINSVNIAARLQGEEGCEWKSRLGDDRKRIGDFACFLTLFLGMEAR